jgi:hypothetical protein
MRTCVPSGSARASRIDCTGVGVGLGDGVGAGVGVGVGTGVGVGVGAGVGVAVGVGSGVAVGSGVGTGLGVGGAVGAELGVGVGLGVGNGVAVGVGTGEPPGSGVGGDARFWGVGTVTWKSAALSFVSEPLPPNPPGSRSRLDPAAGAGAATPSTNVFDASPHATASIGLPPTARRTIAPPVAAKPPEYVASAIGAWIPAAFAIRRWRPGSRTVDDAQVALRVTVEPLDVAYTISSPARSTGPLPAFAISANSSEADAPPVWTSETTKVEVGQATARANVGIFGIGADTRGPGRWAAKAKDVASRTRTRANGRAVRPTRRVRDIDDLPAGLSDTSRG